MIWKPTDEMIEIAEEAFSNVHDMDVPWEAYCEAVTIAVQPLIAAEATASLQAELEASMAEIAQLRIDLAQARAMALEAAAVICDENAEDNTDNARRHQQATRDARDIRRLIPKPPEPV